MAHEESLPKGLKTPSAGHDRPDGRFSPLEFKVLLLVQVGLKIREASRSLVLEGSWDYRSLGL